MDAIEKRLEYHELLMVNNVLSTLPTFDLPNGYSFVFWSSDNDIKEWVRIHKNSGEFVSDEYAYQIFNKYYSSFLHEIKKRCFFIEDSSGRKVGTATISPANEFGYKCVIDWLAIEKSSQGKSLAKPLIIKTLQTAKSLGYNKILLHTQTHSWLAAKLYLDLGFDPFKIEQDLKGWQILKTITNHSKLSSIKPLTEDKLYFQTAINIVNNLNKLHTNYEYQIWHKNGMNDVYVNKNNKVFHYKYYKEGSRLILQNKK